MDCGLPFGSQLPRPLVDWSVSDKDAFLSNTSPLDRSRECGKKTALGLELLALCVSFQHRFDLTNSKALNMPTRGQGCPVDISTASISVHGVALTFTIAMMRFLLRLLPLCFLILLPPTSVMAQTANLAHPPKPGTDGVYEVSASNLKKLDSSPAAEFPSELSAYEVTDTVAIEVTVSPEGRVRKAKAVSGKIEALKDAAEKAVKKWAFEPYLVNGTPVPVRTEITLNSITPWTTTVTRTAMLRCIWTRRLRKDLSRRTSNRNIRRMRAWPTFRER